MTVSPLGVAASLILIAVAVALSARERLGLERSILWAAARAAAQLLAIGGALGLVLADGTPLVWSWLWVAAMVVIGGVTRGIYTVADARRWFPNEKKIGTDTVPYDKVEGRASAQEIHEALAQAEANQQQPDSGP